MYVMRQENISIALTGQDVCIFYELVWSTQYKAYLTFPSVSYFFMQQF